MPGSHPSLHIGLINNMPLSAVEATERQFRTLLTEASAGIEVHLSLFTLPEIPRSSHDKRLTDGYYSDINSLWNTRLDGVIVTGAEPQTPNLTDEPYWEGLAKLVEWAEHNVSSSIWSCLAAHAAVLKLDGIKRQPLDQKLFGVFECVSASGTSLRARLTDGIPETLWVPHSRWNDIPAKALAECGYQVLTQSQSAGIDTFVKQKNSLFVCFQGHPEYEADTLLLEYRRDVGRFLQGERSAYPLIPVDYFDEEAVAASNHFRDRALSLPNKKLHATFPITALNAKLKNSWRSSAVGIYGNWLRYLVEQKKSRKKFTPANEYLKDVPTYQRAIG